VLTLRVSIPESLIVDKEQAARTHEQIVRRIEQIAGVTSRSSSKTFQDPGAVCPRSAASTRVMSSLLFGVSAIDPLTYAAVVTGLGATALLASYIPAARASRMDPTIALRWEA
jgi:ABC-type antimicrobial peptide transport system permease subunit